MDLNSANYFRPGDQVRPIDFTGRAGDRLAEYFFRKGDTVFTVQEVSKDGSYVFLKEFSPGFRASRFKLVKGDSIGPDE